MKKIEGTIEKRSKNSRHPSDELRPCQILKVTVPCLFSYCLIGMPRVGGRLLEHFNLTDDAVSLGSVLWNFLWAAILLMIIPALIVSKRFGVKLSSLGTQKGDWSLGKKLLGLSLIAIPLLYFGTNDPQLISEYPLTKVVLSKWYWFALYEVLYGFAYYIPYEFFFRGFMQIGLNQTWNKWKGIALVTAVTTFIHWIPMYKPVSEIVGAFAVGIAFGYFAEKTRSWYYVFAIHYLIGFLNDLYCGLRYLGKI